MDNRLQRALDISNHRINLLNAKENIKIKVDTMLTHAVNGGIFKINRELITFSKMMLDSEYNTLVLIDDYDNPIEIDNLEDFYNEILNKYFTATNYYNFEYNKLKQSRTTSQQFSDIVKDADS